jgi:arylsulfatase A-like enzyme
MIRRHFLCGLGSAAFAAPKPSVRPNIVLLLASDTPASVQAPAIDLLARGGARFRFAFTCTPDPAAARRAALSGLLPRQRASAPALADMQTAAGAEAACAFLSAQSAGKPFFLTATAGSGPADADRTVAAVQKQLASQQLTTQTLVIFTSLQARQTQPPDLLDTTVAVPFLWNWPGRIPVEAVRPELVSVYDIVPTLAAMFNLNAGAAPRCGRDISRFIFNQPAGKKTPRWRDLVFAQSGALKMARDNRHKLILRDGGEGDNELYDLRQDPAEQHNVYANPGYITTRDALAKELAAFRRKFA